MGFLTSMWGGVAGLNSHGRALSSVSDNIANVNTHGYKSTRTNFGDIMVQSLTVGGTVVSQVGSGSRVLSVQQQMTQGSFETTDVPTDLAINGQGFFKVARPDANGATGGASYYTRAGQFLMDKEGYLVTPLGDRLQGYNVDSNGDILQIPTDLRVLAQQADAIPTSMVDLSVNLDAEDTQITDPSQPINPLDQDTWNYLTSMRTYDSLGIAHDISLFFQRMRPDSYTFSQLDPNASVWKVSAFENEDGTFTQDNIADPDTFFIHFDTDGHLLGITTGQQATGASYQSAGTFTGAGDTISQRVGESLAYTGITPPGQQTFLSNLTVSGIGANWNDPTDSIVVGGMPYVYDAATMSTGQDLAAAINGNAATTGIYANWDGVDLTLYGTGSSSGTFTSSDAAITATGQTLNDLMNSVNNGDISRGAINFTKNLGGNVDGAVTITIGSQVINIADNSTAAVVQGQIQAALAAESGFGGWTVNINDDSAGDSFSIYIESPATGSIYNYSITSNNGSHQVAGSSLTGGINPTNDTGTLTGTGVQATLSPVDPTNPAAGYYLQLGRTDTGAAATMTVDSSNLGMGLPVSFAFEQWTWAADPIPVGDTTGNLNGEQRMTFNWLNEYGSTEPQVITFDFSPDSAGTTQAASASTQSAGDSDTSYLYQDGASRGSLESVDIDRDGIITGQFSNGTLRTLGQVLLADFASPDGLERVGDNLWKATTSSGPEILNTPGEGGVGTVESGSLENSNVDLANEFVKMILYQRGFQANSKTIQTTDTLLGELINLKR